ncbi:MAG: L-fucose/L-arabinose isomerase family protein, partial [Mobilitalea sp.]
MNKQLKVGFITSLSGRWPRELPEKRLKEYGDWLEENLPGVNIIKAESLVDSTKAVEDITCQFKKEEVDLVILVYGAFTGDDIPTCLAENLAVPIVLWAPKEPNFDKKDRLYANALVAVTMNSASLKKLGFPCYTIYGDKEEAATAD